MFAPKLLCILLTLGLSAQVFADDPTPVEEWKPVLKWSGDLRYRMARGKESIDEERKYQQLRARLGLRAGVNEKVQAIVRLATASSAISNNQTMGDSSEPGMARRSFGLDWAYIDWGFLQSGKFWTGRTANPFWSPAKSQIVFDSDLAFEGLALKWEPTWSRTGAFLNLGAFMVSENYSAGIDSVDIGIVGGDAGWMWKTSNFSWTTHVGNYYFLNLITRVDKDAKIDPYSYPHDRYKGNTVYVDDPLLPADQRKYYFQTEYVLVEVGTEWKHKIGQFEYSLYGDLARNTKVGRLGRALEYGWAVKWKMLTLSRSIIKKESDSVVGAFTDSDANGGGTDHDGARTGLSVQLGKSVVLAANYYNGRRGVDTVSRKYSATHVDLSVSF